jgi:hypothetical protein
MSDCDHVQWISAQIRKTSGGHRKEEATVYLRNYREDEMDEMNEMDEIDRALQMTNRLGHILPKAGNDGTGWSKSHNIIDLFILYEDEFSARYNAEKSFSLVVTYDSLLPIGLFFKEDTPAELLCR